MANELNIQLNPFTETGLTLIGKVYDKTGTQVGSNVSMTDTNSVALYTGDFSLGAVSDGAYLVRFETNTPDKLYGTGELFVRENAEVGIDCDVTSIDGDTTSAVNLKLQYNTTGISGPSFPATQDQVTNITTGSAAVNEVAESYVLTTGTQDSGTYESTHALDNVRHIHSDTAGVLDLYYQFDIGADGIPTSSKVVGAITGNNDQVGIYAYNWVTTNWDQVGTIIGSQSTTNQTFNFDLFTAHVGTGANIGTTRIRFYQASGLSTATLYVDQILLGHTIAAGGIANGSSVTLTESTINQTLTGSSWNLDLNSQDINGSYFEGCKLVTGTGISTNDGSYVFKDCTFKGANLTAQGFLIRCILQNSLPLVITSTAGVTEDIFSVVDGVSGVAGTGTPSIDASGCTKTTSLNFRRWSGGLAITVNSDVTASIDVVSGGNIKVYGTGGNIAIRGICTVQDFSSGAVTITETSVINRETIAEAAKTILHQGMAQGAGSGTAQIQLDTGASSIDGAYDPSMIYISEGTGAGQSRLILEYNGTTKIAAVDRSWKVAPDTTSLFIIEASLNTNSINEGTLQGATINTATLNALACVDDKCYVGQMIWLRGGTGEDQSNLILAYNGTTKIATLERNWTTTPDNTTSYMVIPASPVLLAETTHTGTIIPNVTLVNTTTTNTDMRGTDGANTIAPDNAGITSNGNAIAALNDFDQSIETVIVGTNNDKTGYLISGTKTTLDALNDITAANVWAYTTRTLTSFGTTVTDIWSYVTRTLTAGTKDTEIDAIKAKTDNLPADPASETNVDTIPTNPLLTNDTRLDNLDATISSRASQASIDVVDSNVDAIKERTDNLPDDPSSKKDVYNATQI